jgi:hypothetical protein
LCFYFFYNKFREKNESKNKKKNSVNKAENEVEKKNEREKEKKDEILKRKGFRCERNWAKNIYICFNAFCSFFSH